MSNATHKSKNNERILDGIQLAILDLSAAMGRVDTCASGGLPGPALINLRSAQRQIESLIFIAETAIPEQ